MTLGYVTRRCGTFLLVVWIALTVNFILPRVATPEVSRPRGDAPRLLLGTTSLLACSARSG
jgi:hypothetical protein